MSRKVNLFNTGMLLILAASVILFTGADINMLKPIAQFETVKITENDWGGARWLRGSKTRAAAMFRKQFLVDGSVEKARLYISGLGLYVLTINGQSVDDSVLNNSVTQYNKTIPYGVYDVGHLLKQGENAIGVELGDGPFSDRSNFVNFFYGFRGGTQGSGDWAPWLTRAHDAQRLLFCMNIEYSDKPAQTIISDKTWRFTNMGPVTRNEFWEGESYDARLEMPGWNSPGYKEGLKWRKASYTIAPPGGELKYSYIDPIKKIMEFEPLSVNRLADGNWVITAPEMMSGWMSLRINAERGTELIIQYGENINQSGGTDDLGVKYLAGSVKPTIDRGFGTRTLLQKDNYIACGKPDEKYEPKFKYNSFQYIQISGYPADGTISKDKIKLYRVSNAVRSTSEFSTSSEYINKLHHMMRMTLLNNFQGRPTDTPVFEKQGYGGDVIAVLPSMTFNFDTSRFLLHYHDALRDTQGPNGAILNRAPGNERHDPKGEGYDPTWGSVYIFIADILANMYGMQDVIEERYDSMKALATWYIQQSRDRFNWTWANNRYGDWLAPGNLSSPNQASVVFGGSQITASAYVYFSLEKMEKFALQLGKKNDAEIFRDAMTNIANAYNSDLWNQQMGFYRLSGPANRFRQTSNYLPLAMGIVPEDRKDRVVQNILKNLETIGYRIDTGFLGARYILPFLSDYGSNELALKLLNNRNFPGWGYWVENGATSLWEEFPLNTRSRNHFFWGSYDNWFHEYLAGVKNVKDGFKTFTLKPSITPELDWVSLKLDTVRGELVSKWEIKNGKISYTAVIPAGSNAEIHLPANGKTYLINNKQQNNLTLAADGLVYKELQNGFAVFEAGTGNYVFTEVNNQK